jgi:hypothetical protein
MKDLWIFHASHRIQELPEAFVRIGLKTQETTLGIDPNFKAIWDPRSPSTFQSTILSNLERSASNPSSQQPQAALKNLQLSTPEPQASTERQDVQADSLLSSPSLASRVPTPSSSSSGTSWNEGRKFMY